MGTNQFQKEYIQYLEEQNAELLNKLNQVKDNYEKKILSKDIHKDVLISALEEVLHICRVIPQEMDIFFDKVTAALSTFKGLLLRKSEMLLLAEKIKKVINPSEEFNNDLDGVGNAHLLSDGSPESTANKKVGMVKVSPMINGHLISTEPKIYLSRVPGVVTPNRRNVSESNQLSPIIEASPEVSSSFDHSGLQSNIFKEIKIPLERVNLTKRSEESPKTRLKEAKSIKQKWKESLSSYERQSNTEGKTGPLETNESLNKELSTGENELSEVPENDPLEGPSWLHKQSPGMSPSVSRFINCRRRKRRFASVLVNVEDSPIYPEDTSKMSSKEDGIEFDEESEKMDDETINGSSNDDSSTPFKRRTRVSRRKDTKNGNKTDSTETDDTKNQKIIIWDSSDEGGDKENSVERFSKERQFSRRLSLRSSFAGMSVELSFEKTTRRSGCADGKVRRSSRSEVEEMESPGGKPDDEMNTLVKLNDGSSTGECTGKRSARRVSKKRTSKKESTSMSPGATLTENEGRKRRKAAPSFKLVEPKLNVKLRRN